MRLIYHFYSLLLSLFLHRELFPQELPVTIKEVSDGDSLVVQLFGRTERVRLAFIDAPEIGQRSLDQKVEAGEFAKSCLKRLASKTMSMQWLGRDIYGRVLGRFYDLEIKLLEAGCVSVYGPTVHLCPECWRARERAMRARRGLWKYGGLMRPSVYRALSKKKARSKRALILGRKKS